MKVLALIVLILSSIATPCLANDIQVYFSPNGGCEDAVISEINGARQSMDIAMYYLTSRGIAQALVSAKQRNVQIRIVLDKSQEIQDSAKSRYLIKRGFAVKYHTGDGLMHNKFAVIDGRVLITGSFNWTPTANYKNEENLLIIKDEPIIEKYSQRFEYLWGNAKTGALPKPQPFDPLRDWVCSIFPGLCGQ